MTYSGIDFCKEIYNNYENYNKLWEKHNLFKKSDEKTRRCPSARGSYVEELVKGYLVKYFKNNNMSPL